jgi:cyclopropane fatty-acyl-phospholipid synthase-like methyltransferase
VTFSGSPINGTIYQQGYNFKEVGLGVERGRRGEEGECVKKKRLLASKYLFVAYNYQKQLHLKRNRLEKKARIFSDYEVKQKMYQISFHASSRAFMHRLFQSCLFM